MRTKIDRGESPGPFSPVIRDGEMVYVAGQGGLVDGAVVQGGITAETAQALANIEKLLTTIGAGVDDLVAVTCYLVDIREWDQMNVEWTKFFVGRAVPTRTAIGVAGLPRGMRVEMTATAIKR
ncbi:MAG TPA: RidA family protein [Lacisediminihabitans sp.]|uniref:RidA family protein n=1 Tax=Lacisediminihabitans sp. TaxID=2787631 RepID=UPI002EDB1BB9